MASHLPMLNRLCNVDNSEIFPSALQLEVPNSGFGIHSLFTPADAQSALQLSQPESSTGRTNEEFPGFNPFQG
jgi:hypothetical protein